MSSSWNFNFAAPTYNPDTNTNDGNFLEAGFYDNAERSPFNSPTFESALSLLQTDSSFREKLTQCFIDSEYETFRWEAPPITRNRLDQPFEFVLINSRSSKAKAEPEVFASYFVGIDPPPSVLAFPNLGKTAMLVVPVKFLPLRRILILQRS